MEKVCFPHERPLPPSTSAGDTLRPPPQRLPSYSPTFNPQSPSPPTTATWHLNKSLSPLKNKQNASPPQSHIPLLQLLLSLTFTAKLPTLTTSFPYFPLNLTHCTLLYHHPNEAALTVVINNLLIIKSNIHFVILTYNLTSAAFSLHWPLRHLKRGINWGISLGDDYLAMG